MSNQTLTTDSTTKTPSSTPPNITTDATTPTNISTTTTVDTTTIPTTVETTQTTTVTTVPVKTTEAPQGLGGGAIAGIVVGTVAAIAIIVVTVIVVLILRRKRQNRSLEEKTLKDVKDPEKDTNTKKRPQNQYNPVPSPVTPEPESSVVYENQGGQQTQDIYYNEVQNNGKDNPGFAGGQLYEIPGKAGGQSDQPLYENPDDNKAKKVLYKKQASTDSEHMYLEMDPKKEEEDFKLKAKRQNSMPLHNAPPVPGEPPLYLDLTGAEEVDVKAVVPEENLDQEYEVPSPTLQKTPGDYQNVKGKGPAAFGSVPDTPSEDYQNIEFAKKQPPPKKKRTGKN